MSFNNLNQDQLITVQNKLNELVKSFNAGFPGLANANRSGVGALAIENLDNTLRSITIDNANIFYLTRDPSIIKARQSVYTYTVQNSLGINGMNLGGVETYLPQSSNPNYNRFAEVIKVLGIEHAITHMTQLINAQDGYIVDAEKELDKAATFKINEFLERSIMVGGDYFLNSVGNIDGTIAVNQLYSQTIPEIRGVQANVREADSSIRGISQDFVAYGNDRSVVFNRNGSIADRAFIDKVVTAIKDGGLVSSPLEAICTTSMIAEFRATFFNSERVDMSAWYMPKGLEVQNEDISSILPIGTVGGILKLRSSIFRYMRTRPQVCFGQFNNPVAVTSIGAPAASGSVTGSGFTAGSKFTYVIQGKNLHGISAGVASSLYTTAGGDVNKAVQMTVTLPGGHNLTELLVFRNPIEVTSGDATKTAFIGRIPVLPTDTSIVVVDNNKIIPGLDSMLFMPIDKNKFQLYVLGNMINKIPLAIKGLVSQLIYVSYCAVVVHRPRANAVVDNVYQDRSFI